MAGIDTTTSPPSFQQFVQTQYKPSAIPVSTSNTNTTTTPSFQDFVKTQYKPTPASVDTPDDFNKAQAQLSQTHDQIANTILSPEAQAHEQAINRVGQTSQVNIIPRSEILNNEGENMQVQMTHPSLTDQLSKQQTGNFPNITGAPFAGKQGIIHDAIKTAANVTQSVINGAFESPAYLAKEAANTLAVKAPTIAPEAVDRINRGLDNYIHDVASTTDNLKTPSPTFTEAINSNHPIKQLIRVGLNTFTPFLPWVAAGALAPESGGASMMALVGASQTMGELTKQAERLNMTPAEQTNYVLTGAGTALASFYAAGKAGDFLNKLGAQTLTKLAADNAEKELVSGATKDAALQTFKNTLANSVKNYAVRTAQGTTQMGLFNNASDFSNNLANWATGVQKQTGTPDPISAQAGIGYAKDWLGALLFSMGLASPGIIPDVAHTAAYNVADEFSKTGDPTTINNIKQSLADQVQQGKLSPEKVALANVMLDKMVADVQQHNAKFPDTYLSDPAARYQAFNISQQRDALNTEAQKLNGIQENIQQLDPAVQPKAMADLQKEKDYVQQKTDVANNHLTAIVNNNAPIDEQQIASDNAKIDKANGKPITTPVNDVNELKQQANEAGYPIENDTHLANAVNKYTGKDISTDIIQPSDVEKMAEEHNKANVQTEISDEHDNIDMAIEGANADPNKEFEGRTVDQLLEDKKLLTDNPARYFSEQTSRMLDYIKDPSVKGEDRKNTEQLFDTYSNIFQKVSGISDKELNIASNDLYKKPYDDLSREDKSHVLSEASARKETISPLNTEQNAVQEQSAGSVLQHPQETTPTSGGKRVGMEQGEQGKEVATTGNQTEEKIRSERSIQNENAQKANEFTPQTPEEAAMQYFATGGKIHNEDFKSETGFGSTVGDNVRGMEEYNAKKTLRSPNGTRMDDIVQHIDRTLQHSTGIEHDQNDIRNAVIQTLSDHDTQTQLRAKLAEIKDDRDFQEQHGISRSDFDKRIEEKNDEIVSAIKEKGYENADGSLNTEKLRTDLNDLDEGKYWGKLLELDDEQVNQIKNYLNENQSSGAVETTNPESTNEETKENDQQGQSNKTINDGKEEKENADETQRQENVTEGGKTAPIPESGGRETGISHEAMQETSENLGIKAPDRGIGSTPEQQIELGRNLITKGYEAKNIVSDWKDGKVGLSDAIAIARAHQEELTKAAYKAEDDFGAGSKEANAAGKELEDWNKEIKPLATEWQKAGVGLQGKTDIDTGSYIGAKASFKDIHGEEPNKEVAEKLKSAVEENKTLAAENDALTKKINDLIDESFKKGTSEQNGNIVIPKRGKALIAEGLDELASSLGWTQRAIGDVKPDAKAALVKIGKGLIDEGLAKADDVFEKVKEYVKDKWGRDLPDNYKDDLIAGLKPEPTDITTRFADKKDNNFSPKDSRDIWSYAKENYINEGSSVADMIKGVSADLGLTSEQVRNAIASKKTVQNALDKLDANRYRQNQAINEIKQIVTDGNQSRAKKAILAIPDLLFAARVAWHGTVGMFTHAGMNAFDPPHWSQFYNNFIRQFKFAYGGITEAGKARYQRAMDDLQNNPNFLLANKAGLQNDPNLVSDEYQGMKKYISKIFGSNVGTRGFNALKTMRQDLFDSYWNRLPQSLKTSDMAEEIANQVNHATGTTTKPVLGGKLSYALFAPRLLASRWARLITEPAKALHTVYKMADGKTATPEEIQSAKMTATRIGTMLATYASALAVNEGILKATGSQQSINFTNPTKSDFLKMKVGTKTVDLSSGMASAVDFIGKLFHASTTPQKELQGKSRGDAIGSVSWDYLKNSFSPLASTLKDFATQHDYAGNTMPFSNDKPDFKSGHKLTWVGYLLQNQTPIPFAEGVANVARSMQDNGMKKPQINDVLLGIASGAITGGTGIRIAKVDDETDANIKQKATDDKAATAALIKSGKPYAKQLSNLIKTGALTEKTKNEFIKDSKLEDYQRDFKNSSAEDQLKTWNNYTSVQQQSLRSLLHQRSTFNTLKLQNPQLFKDHPEYNKIIIKSKH